MDEMHKRVRVIMKDDEWLTLMDRQVVDNRQTKNRLDNIYNWVHRHGERIVALNATKEGGKRKNEYRNNLKTYKRIRTLHKTRLTVICSRK